MAKSDLDQHVGQQRQTASTSVISGELALRIVAGDKSAEGEFVGINYRWLLLIVRRKFNRSNNQEDIVQDAFMLTIIKLKQGAVNKPEAILGFLRTTAIQIGYDYLRKDKKFNSDTDPDLMDTIKDASEDVLSVLIWKDKLSYVKQLMKELKKPRDRDILMKFYLQDIAKPQICEELKLSSAHFDRVIFRAKQRLRKIVETHGDYNDSDKNNRKGSITAFKKGRKSSKNNQNDNNSTNRKAPKLYHYFMKKLRNAIKPMVRSTL